MCGHGHFDLAAYEQHLADNLEDFEYPEEAIRASLEKGAFALGARGSGGQRGQ